jgi:hypothetical protein
MTNSWKRVVSVLSALPYSVTDILVEIEGAELQAKALLAAVNEVPKAHRDTLQFLVFHLSRVIQHASDNLVSTSAASPNMDAN